jgi:O-antigen ligase
MKFHRLFFYLTILFLPTQLGYHFWPEWAMVLGRRVDYLAPTLYLTDATIIFTLFFWVINILNYESGSKKYDFTNIKNILKYFNQNIIHNSYIIIFLIGFIVLNVLFSQTPQVAIYKWIKLFEFGLFGLYIVKTKPNLSIISFLLSVAIIYSSIIAIFQFYFQHSLGGIIWWLGERTFNLNTPGIARFNLCLGKDCREVLRSYGTFPHPNVLGGFLVVSLILIINQLVNQISNIKYQILNMHFKYQIVCWTYIASGFLGFIGLILTFSRSAWGVGIAGLLIVVLKQHYPGYFFNKFKLSELKIKNYELRAKLLFIIFLILIPVSYFLIQLGATINLNSESLVVRNELNLASLNMFVHSPILGVGLGNYLVNLPNYLVKHQVYFIQPVHNIYLLLLSEVGFVGVGLLVMIIIFALKYEVRIIKCEPKVDKNIRFMILASLFMILVLGLFDHYPLTLQQGQLMTTLIFSLLFAKHEA